VHHVTPRCNNREFLFEPSSLRLFGELLQGARKRFSLLLYNYCLMEHRDLGMGIVAAGRRRGRPIGHP